MHFIFEIQFEINPIFISFLGQNWPAVARSPPNGLSSLLLRKILKKSLKNSDFFQKSSSLNVLSPSSKRASNPTLKKNKTRLSSYIFSHPYLKNTSQQQEKFREIDFSRKNINNNFKKFRQIARNRQNGRQSSKEAKADHTHGYHAPAPEAILCCCSSQQHQQQQQQ